MIIINTEQYKIKSILKDLQSEMDALTRLNVSSKMIMGHI